MQGYAGHAQHIAGRDLRRRSVGTSTDRLVAVIDALESAGHHVGVRTGGGTGTGLLDIERGVLTELQVGSYVFMDREYRDALGTDPESRFAQSLTLVTTVISSNQTGFVTVDAGLKSMATDAGVPVMADHPEATYAFFGDEQGLVDRHRRMVAGPGRTDPPGAAPLRSDGRPLRPDLAHPGRRGGGRDCGDRPGTLTVTRVLDPRRSPDAPVRPVAHCTRGPTKRRRVMAIGQVGMKRSPVSVILLTIITLGIYGLYWQYSVFKDLKEYSGEGIGGGLALLFAFFICIVNIFLLPMEIGNLYARDGQEQPVSGLTGFWILIPIVGWFIWLVKVQSRMNEFWDAHTASAPSAA